MKIPDNIDMKQYDNRFVRILFLSIICTVIPPTVLSLVATFFWDLNWVVAATILLAGSGVVWVLIFFVTANHVKFIHIELRLELRAKYGAFDEDGMPLVILTDDEEEEPVIEKPVPPRKEEPKAKKTGKKKKADEKTAEE